MPALQPFPIGITHVIGGGGSLNGTGLSTTETTASTVKNGRVISPILTHGGLFDFGHERNTVTLAGVEMVLGGQASWKVAITDGLDNLPAFDVLLAEGANESTVLLGETITTYLLPGQKIRVTAVGAVPAGATWRITVKGAATFSEAGLFVG